MRLVVGGGCCDLRLCGQMDVFFFVVNTIQKIYQIKCHVFPVMLMYKNRVHRSKHPGLFQSANPAAQVCGLGGVPFALPKSHAFTEISLFENLGKFASFWGNVKVAFLLGKPWINLKIWGPGAGLLPHMWAYCTLIAP